VTDDPGRNPPGPVAAVGAAAPDAPDAPDAPGAPDAPDAPDTPDAPDAAESGAARRPEAVAARSAAPARLPWARFVVVALLVLLDLWTKQAVFAWLGGDVEGVRYDDHGHLRYGLAGEWLAFMLSYNPGAAFGQLGDVPHLLVGGRVLAVLVLAWLLFRAERHRGALLAALVLVLAGALGNLYDNLFLDVDGDSHPFGLVRDFIDVYFTRWDYHFPTFNVADSCITVGAVLLLVSGFLPQRGEEVP